MIDFSLEKSSGTNKLEGLQQINQVYIALVILLQLIKS